MESTAAITILLPTTLLSTILIALLLNRFYIHKGSSAPYNLPPGPWKLPIIGNLHQLIGEHPHRRLRTLANTYGPILHLKLGENNLIVITSAELVREVFKTHDLKFASRPKLALGKIIMYDSADFGLAPYGKVWSQLRKICTVELLSPKRVKSFGFIREEEGRNLVEKIRAAAGSPVNLSKLIRNSVNTGVARAVFGKDNPHQEIFLLAVKKMFKYASGFELMDIFPSWSFLAEITGSAAGMRKVHRQLDAIVTEIIDEHEAKNSEEEDDVKDDLVDVLLRLKKAGQLDFFLTMENIKAVILDLFLAGTESSSVTLQWVMTELIRHPEIMQKAQHEIRNVLHGKRKIEDGDIPNLPYLNQIIKETLRLHTTGPLLFPRLCQESVELAGYTVPVESQIVINAWAIMRDPIYWEDPESFRPERFDESATDFRAANFEFIPFGGGRRVCPGIQFAVASIGCLLAHLLFYFDWDLPQGKRPQELDIEEEYGLTLSRKNDLCLITTYC
ncbi:Premnaspirodiene oxygenase [Platanthera guangdongensis]|uniref:Premnaspirodiene oxygenase n=1 Tax=Platanthera guangdongensis TaxID=2320717 RepID=A0ABR2MDF1_9ASPA